MSGAVDLLQARTGKNDIGVVGFCMGGGLALVLACQRPDAVAAVAPYYGVIPWPTAQPSWTDLRARVIGEYAELDDFAGPDAVHSLEIQLRDLGKDATLNIHEGCHHAFFNDSRPDVYDRPASAVAFARTIELFRATL
jgi:carboxymethylenebutenolidase